jgi:uncharacterized membrane protein YfcA
MIVAGIIAAPIAALITKKLNPRTVGIVVGVMIIVLSLRTILLALSD